jgi:hypothetical protein
LRIKWQSCPAQLTKNLKQPNEKESFNYITKLISNETRYIGEIKTRIVMKKEYSKSTILHRKYWKRELYCATIRAYLCNVLNVRQFENYIIST